MRTLYTVLLATFFFISCDKKKKETIEDVIATKDIKKIRNKKSDLDKEVQEISSKIKILNVEIEKLDTLKRRPLVTAIALKNEVFKHYLELQGNVKTKQNVLIYPEMAGTLERVFVKEGQRVSKGQVLAKIDDGGMAQQVAQVATTVALAKTTYERQKRLWEQKIGSEIQFLQAETNYKASENSLAQLKKQLGKSNIKAPFSGVIDDVIKYQGTVVAPGIGSEVCSIVNLGDMYI